MKKNLAHSIEIELLHIQIDNNDELLQVPIKFFKKIKFPHKIEGNFDTFEKFDRNLQ
jgi:hypothetical protein